MRKTLLIVTSLIAMTFTSAFADGFDTSAEEGPIIFRQVYYGTQASTHPNNPCKGATTRKCAELFTSLTAYADCTMMTSVLTNEKGEELMSSEQTVYSTPDEIIAEKLKALPDNATFEMGPRTE